MTENMNGSFEDRLQQVENLIAGIEGGKLTLEDSVKQYEDGMKALKALEEELKEMNRRISVLRDGKEEPLETEAAHEGL
jgi:exodeoxyribonuclease VII small subunit